MSHKARRFALGLFLLGLLLFLGLLFSSWIVPHLLLPAATAVWFFLRIFILSISQESVWWLLTLAVAIWSIYRLTRRPAPVATKKTVIQQAAESSLRDWQEALSASTDEDRQRSLIQRKLLLLITSFYEAQQQDSNPVEIRLALEQRRLPLPDAAYQFLVQPEPAQPRRLSWRGLSRRCRRWVRRLTGRSTAEFQRMIDELILFLDPTMEKKNEHGTDR